MDQELRCFPRKEGSDPADVVKANLQDQVTAVMLAVQRSWSSSMTPRFLTVGEGPTTASSTVTSRSM